MSTLDNLSNGLVDQQIRAWIMDHVCISEVNKGACRKLILRHLNINKKPQGDVQAFNVQPEAGAGEIDALVSQVVNAAVNDATSLNSGIQLYAIYAQYPNDPSYVPRRVFRVASATEEEIERDVDPSEPPTEKGLVSQLMRHNEIVSKNAMVGMGYMFQTFQRENTRMSDMIDRFSTQQIDMMLLVQDTMDDAHKRRMEEKKTEMELSLREGVFEHLKMIFPIIANRVAGKQLFAEPDKSFYMMASLMESMEPDQQMEILERMSPHQQTMFAEMMNEYRKKKEELTMNSPDKELYAKGEKGTLSGQMKPMFGNRGGLPASMGPSQMAGKTKSMTAPSKEETREVPLMAESPDIPMFQKRTDIINKDDASKTADETMQKFEKRAANFMASFKDMAFRKPRKG